MLQDNLMTWMKLFETELGKKSDTSGVFNVEQKIMEQFNQIVEAFNENFAEKNETKKAIRKIE